MLETGNLNLLLKKEVEYDPEILVKAFDCIIILYKEARGKDPFRLFLKTEFRKVKLINKIVGLSACYDLLKLGNNEALKTLIEFSISLKDNSHSQREILRSRINAEQTKLRRLIKSETSKQENKPKQSSTWSDRIVIMQSQLSFQISEYMTLEKFIALDKQIEKTNLQQKKISNGR